MLSPEEKLKRRLPSFLLLAGLLAGGMGAPAAQAAPDFWNKGTFTSGAGALSVPVPAPYADGDVFLLFVESARQPITTPSGWTVVASSQGTGTPGGAGAVQLDVFYKVVSGAQAAVSVAASGNHTTAIIANFRGVDTSAPIHLTAGGVDASATTSLSAPGLTTTITDTLIVNAIGLDKDGNDTDTLSAAANPALTSLTERHDETVNTGAGGGIAFITGVKASAGATGNTTATGNSSTTHAYITIALKGFPPTDLTLNSADITFSTGIAQSNEVVKISATIQNIGSLVSEIVEEVPIEGNNNGYAIYTGLWSAQGFGNGSSIKGLVTAVELYAANYITIGDSMTVEITTGTSTMPTVGAQVLASTTAATAALTLDWLKFTFNEPVSLPVLPGTDRYHLIAKNWENNGYIWDGWASSVYPNGNDADSTNQGVSWTPYTTYDMVLRVYQSLGAEIYYYHGDPDAGGTLIGVSTIPVFGAAPYISTMNWTATMPEGYHNIYVYIDRNDKISEGDETNNKNFNTVAVSSAPDAVKNMVASASTTASINLTWNATGDDGFTGDLNNSTFTIQYTSVTAWAQGNSWSTNTASVPGYVYTVDIATTGVAAGSQRFYRQTGLLANTTYFFRLWTHDDFLAWSPLSNGATAATLAEPVTGTQIYKVVYTSVTVNWQPRPVSPPSSTCEGYRLQASTASNFTGVVYSSMTLSVSVGTLTIKGLGTNTTYYFRVGSLNWIGEVNYILIESTCTLKPPPGSSPLDPEVSAVYLSSMTMKWTSVSSDDGYLVQASTALDFTGTVSSSETAAGTLETLTVSAPSLDSNTSYYLRVGALWGATTSYAATQAAATLANPVSWAEFKEVFITSASASWQALPETPQTAACEGYRLDASTASNFTGLIYSSSTPSVLVTTLTVSGLSPNTTYYFRIGTLNWDSAGNYLFLISTPTLASPPGQASPTALSVSSYSITAQWTSGSPANPSDTNYVLEASSSNFAGGDMFSSQVAANLQAEVSGLMANTTYYLRARAINRAGRSVYSPVLGSTSTLAQQVWGAQFFQVDITSVTANWVEFPVSPSSSSCGGYILQASTASDFTGEIFSSSTINGVVPSTLTVKNLYSDTWYYFRAGSYNWNFVPNYISLGSAKTNIAVPPPDLMITNSDIKFSPTAADFGWVVLISATVRNLSYNFMERSILQEAESGFGWNVDTLRPQGQGFVISDAPACLKSVQIKGWDAGTAGDVTTVEITTGTTSIPYIGNNGAKVLASKSLTISGGSSVWRDVVFDEPVCLPVLNSGDAYWIIASNPASAGNGAVWHYRTGNPYTPAASAASADGGATWTTGATDLVFRVYYSSCIEVSYYDGDPDAGGTYIGVSTIPLINTNQTRVSTISWTATSPEAYHNIYVHVDRANKIGESDESNNKAFNSIAISSAPDKVIGFAASTNSTTAIDLKWYATGDDGFIGNLNNSTFTIQYTYDAAWAQGNSWSPADKYEEPYIYRVDITTTGVTAGSQRFYTRTGLSINTTYYFRLWIKDDFGRYSSLSNGATVCTLANPPLAPAESFTGVYFSSVSVYWLANSNPDYTQYRLQASTASDHTGTLYGPYAGPTGSLVGTSTSAVSLLGCSTFYFWVQAINGGSIATDFQLLGSTRTDTYFDAGLRVFDGTQNVRIACQPTYCDTVPPLRIRKEGVNYAVGLVDEADPKASKLKIQTPAGIKYWRKY